MNLAFPIQFEDTFGANAFRTRGSPVRNSRITLACSRLSWEPVWAGRKTQHQDEV